MPDTREQYAQNRLNLVGGNVERWSTLVHNSISYTLALLVRFWSCMCHYAAITVSHPPTTTPPKMLAVPVPLVSASPKPPDLNIAELEGSPQDVASLRCSSPLQLRVFIYIGGKFHGSTSSYVK